MPLQSCLCCLAPGDQAIDEGTDARKDSASARRALLDAARGHSAPLARALRHAYTAEGVRSLVADHDGRRCVCRGQ